MDAIFVGIDVSKDRLDVHVRPCGEAFAVGRDGKGLEQLVDRLRTLAPTLIAVEATGGFETIVAAALAGAALPLVVVNPAQVRHFAQAVGKRAKTDPLDAAMIDLDPARHAGSIRIRSIINESLNSRPRRDRATGVRSFILTGVPIKSSA